MENRDRSPKEKSARHLVIIWTTIVVLFVAVSYGIALAASATLTLLACLTFALFLESFWG